MAIITIVVMLIYSRILTFVVLAALVVYMLLRAATYSIMKRQTHETLITGAKENSIFMESIRAILPLKYSAKRLNEKTFGKIVMQIN